MKKESLLPFAFGLGAGALLSLMLDPQSGSRRRGYVRDKAVHLGKELGRWGNRSARDLKHRLAGKYVEMLNRRQPESDVDEITLVQRIRSELGHKVSHLRGVKVDVSEGVATLSGAVAGSEVDNLLGCVRAVRGVKGVVNHLQTLSSSDYPVDLPG